MCFYRSWCRILSKLPNAQQAAIRGFLPPPLVLAYFIRMRGLIIFLSIVCAAQTLEFNRDVRPILSDRCFSCHGPDARNRQSNLRLDFENSAIVAGNPDASKVIQRVTSPNKSLRMPPQYAGKDPLTAKEISVLQEWIRQGGAYEPHWSLIKPQKRPGPNSIDAFIRERLAREGLAASSEADRTTLLRRVTLDLTGLPPTLAQLDAFLSDSSPGAYERVVEGLLASPRHAERMAILWLEAARYSDTNGYQTDGPRDMWRWRDWVIDAYRANMPFDRFTIEQLAGDLLPNATLDQRLATGFHRNHRTSAEGGIVDEEFRVEYVADRTETTSTVWLGLTIGCARCHDHKYDPLPQRDYYSLFAFFNNVPEKGFVWNFGNEPPVMKAPLPDQQRQWDALDHDVAAKRARWDSLQPALSEAQHQWEKKLPSRKPWLITTDLSLRVLPGTKRKHFDGVRFLQQDGKPAELDYRDPFTFAAWINPEIPDGAILSHSEDYAEGKGHALYLMNGKLRLHAIFRWTDLGLRVESAQPLALNQWTHVAATYDGSMRAAGVKLYVNGEPVPTNILFDSMLWPIDAKEPFRVGAGGGLRFKGSIGDVRVYRRALSPAEVSTLPITAPLAKLGHTNAEKELLRLAFLEKGAPPDARQALADLKAAEAARDKFVDSIPTTMVMAERESLRETHLLKRGAYDNPGERTPPAVPRVLPQLPPGARPDRLALARWLVSRDNPLTARVAVNRLWQMLFGTGLVKTVEDFGSQGEWPTHPELLDWLAVEFMDSGWDVRHMLRLMVTSETYRQSSRVTPDLLQRDPENRLLARGPRFRLSAEMIRDQALAVSGILVEKTGGPSVKPYQPPGLWQELHGGKEYEADHGDGLYRRGLYTYWKRTVAPPLMINFDSPTREVCTVRSSRTNTPLQALNLMNDVTFLEASRKFAERILLEGGTETNSRLRYGYRLLLDRAPAPEEAIAVTRLLNKYEKFYTANRAKAVAYLDQGEAPMNRKLDRAELAAWTGVASLLLNLDETVTRP